jgi:hypothetical protein
MRQTVSTLKSGGSLPRVVRFSEISLTTQSGLPVKAFCPAHESNKNQPPPIAAGCRFFNA